MITIIEKPELPKKVQVDKLKQGDTFTDDANNLFIVTSKREGLNITCVILSEESSGQIVEILGTSMVLQINVRAEITRL